MNHGRSMRIITMHKLTSAILVAISLAAPAMGDYLSDRKAALELVKATKHEDALVAFVAMAEATTSKVQQSDAFWQAALCADRLKQPEQALELAQRIPLAPHAKTCRMQILEGNRRWQDIIDEFQEENIAAWPESLRGPAYLSRGNAFSVMKQGEPATRDLAAAAEYQTDANSKGYCLNLLGDAYRNLLKDDERATAAYRQAFEAGTIYKQCQAAVNIAEILSAQQKYAEALEELNRVNLDELTAPFWRGKLFCAQVKLLVLSGKKDEAKAKFATALQIKDLPDEIRKECEQGLRDK
jgi:tetratricopeptide (TPR) repeat protein